MRELNAENAAAYLRESGRVPEGVPVAVRELSGGVSNIVLRVDVPGRPPLVLKQCRERLRVAMDWRARLDRIWAEVATLRLLGAILPARTVPDILFEDRPEYLFAMTCAPDDAATWKWHLMAGRAAGSTRRSPAPTADTGRTRRTGKASPARAFAEVPEAPPAADDRTRRPASAEGRGPTVP